jgi:flagellar hook-associated protein 1 FlgK
MSLLGALNAGQSGLAAAQASIQVTGNNISNAGNANYTRQTAQFADGPDQQIQTGVFVGSGVDLTGVQRQIDNSIEARLQNATSENQSASTTQQWMTQVESVLNALGTTNLSTSMNGFFSSWSTLANSPQDAGQRQVVIQQGQALAQEFSSERTQLTSLAGSVSSQMTAQAQSADQLSSQIASLNQQIVVAKAGSSGDPNDLMDQRDADLTQLSQLMPVSSVQQPDGSVNVYVGTEPLVWGAQSRGVAVQTQTINGQATPTVVFKDNNQAMPLAGNGQLGALTDLGARITGVVDQVDTLAHNLISAVNQLHSSGQGLQGFTSVTASNTVADTTQSLDSTAAGLDFTPTNGSFVVHVTNTTTGQATSTLVPVTLSGGPGGTSLDSLTASLNAISGVTATDTGGVLKIAASGSNVNLSFSQDSSGTLAALGINTFFGGSNASDISVNSTLAANPNNVAAAQNGDPGDNQTALAISQLATQSLSSLNGASLNDTYQSLVNGVATQVSTATNNVQATQSVQNALQTQRDSLSGVDINEEAVNLIRQQQAFQGAAKLISVVNQLVQTVIGMVQ